MTDNTNPTVSVTAASAADKPVIANLIQLYLYDMTGDLPFAIGRDGRFEYDFLDRFWQHPYLIFSGEDLAGFALVIDHCPITDTAFRFFMAEFFVLKAYRGQGVGRAAVREIFARHPGPWHIGVIDKNGGANAFWSKALSGQAITVSPTHFDGEDWLIHAFTPA